MIRKQRLRGILVVFCGTLLPMHPAGGAEPGETKGSELMVFAAASLVDVLGEIVDAFEHRYECQVRINYASSGTLARQVVQGSSPDIYISANTRWMDYVDSRGYVRESQRTPIAHNDLVLVASKESDRAGETTIDSSLDFVSLVGTDRLSMGNPAHVPAGAYARQSLEYYGWYSEIESRIVPAKDARSALMLVEMGEIPLGIVYRTDALRSTRVTATGVFPSHSHNEIVYTAAMCVETDAARWFFVFLQSDAAQAMWVKYGFRV